MRFVVISVAALFGSLMLATLMLWVRPPALIRIGAAYTAKIVCSNVFLAHRDPQEVLRTDVQAPGHPLLRLMRVTVDAHRGVVRAGLLGFMGGGLAVVRPDVGCAVVSEENMLGVRVPPAGMPEEREAQAVGSGAGYPGGATQPSAKLAGLIADDRLAGPGMRAIVVVHNGRLVAERYGAGFDASTPQLGWSMTKTVTAGLIGILVKQGRLTLDQSAGLEGGGRERIAIADLLAMSSGLEFDEGYGAVSDVTRMLYLEPDMAAFAAAKPQAFPAGAHWSYSSGTALILSRIIQNAAGPDPVVRVRRDLSAALGMPSATLETDAKGTFVGSSYLYATPRDWARYGQLLLQNGLWDGREILPAGYVAMMVAPVAASDGEYGHGLVWRRASHSSSGIPDDSFWMLGHDGQYVAVIPSRALVVVRMGLTPDRGSYTPEPLVRALLDATGTPAP